MRRLAAFIGSIALILASSTLTSAAAESGYCSEQVTSGYYSVRACIDVGQSGAHGYVYVTLWPGHAACTIRAKYLFDPEESHAIVPATTWPCPAGGVTNARYDLPEDYPAISVYTRGAITLTSGTAVLAESPTVTTCDTWCG